MKGSMAWHLIQKGGNGNQSESVNANADANGEAHVSKAVKDVSNNAQPLIIFHCLNWIRKNHGVQHQTILK
ncbi:unnamed protein product [Sphenostylis stenocarpa]|uniref:Uncharacterized protein n=1 Tax=Sphenostylis stenocarpa TaxID=92480 RepID=A0AA86W3S5_9FABA|nr:unnamed protein product [Sphenostylis stenocarpa]